MTEFDDREWRLIEQSVKANRFDSDEYYELWEKVKRHNADDP